MGVVSKLTGGARAARPFVRAMNRIERSAAEGGTVTVLAGDPDEARRLRARLGVPSTGPLPPDGLVIAPLTTPEQAESAARRLAEHARGEGRSLALLVGPEPVRGQLRRIVLAEDGLEPSSVAVADSLEGRGLEDAVRAVVRALGDDDLAAARRHPALRRATARMLISQASRRAGVVAASPFPGGADLPALIVMQVSLLYQLAALYGRPLGPERAAEAAVVAGAGLGWRALARTAAGLVPVAGWAARGAVSYAGTRALGEATLARLEAGEDLLPEPPRAVRERLDPVLARLGRNPS